VAIARPTANPVMGRPALLLAGIGLFVVGFAILGSGQLTPAMQALLTEWNGPLWLSLRIAVISVVIAGIIGIATGYLFSRRSFRGSATLEALCSVPIILPPTVIGYLLLVSLDGTWLGDLIGAVFGQDPVFTIVGCIIAATIAAFPFVVRASRAAFDNVDVRLENASRVMGLPAWRVFLFVTLPLARRGIELGLTLGFLRALGEFGATLMIGGAIRGQTRTLSIAVTDSRTVDETQAVLWSILIIAGIAMLILARLQRESDR